VAPASPGTAPPAPEPQPSGGTEEPPTPTTFHKLRQMLAKLKETTDTEPLVEAGAPDQETTQTVTEHQGANGATPLSAADLLARYDDFRHEIGGSERPLSVELPVISELVRLAGRRFPVINYDEVDLPGLVGRSLPRWSLQGMELVFGLEDFSDNRYWQTVSSFMAGRLAESSASHMAGGLAEATQLKLVMFKGDAEAPALATLLREEAIPPALRGIVDAVHLDPRSLTSLYAMHRIVSETESGDLKAEPNAVLGTLANELDFFWKRVTRPKA
jgi:hypothetical protein